AAYCLRRGSGGARRVAARRQAACGRGFLRPRRAPSLRRGSRVIRNDPRFAPPGLTLADFSGIATGDARRRSVSWSKSPTDRLFEAQLEPVEGEVRLRGEEPRDRAQVRELLEASFPGTGEALLVDRLRSDGDIVLALVAEDRGVVVGYVCFSRVLVEGDVRPFAAVALAPLAVYPEYQHQGIATLLVRESHACLAALGETLSVVL